MAEVILVSLALAFCASIALNIYQSVILGRLKKQVSDRDDLIDDLRTAISGVGSEAADWRKSVL
jgi:hypothetical protein